MTVEIPGYRIVRVLGKGGMATVYLAVQQIFERQVALKVMSTSMAEDPSFGQRFLREARIVSQLVHPNIITVYDVGVHDNAYYLSMEYIDGPDLKQAREQLSLSQKHQIILDIAKALDFAGKKGYVHRDIKPENILLRRDSFSAVLMDFGIARTEEGDLTVTQAGVALGTPHYMSPEQAKGQAVDHRSDLYSLGVVFYYLLTGSVPYHADSAVAIGIKHITEPVPTLPPALQPFQKFIDRLMAKLPQDRYQTAAELIVDLQALNLAAAEKHYKTYEQEVVQQSDPDAQTLIYSDIPDTPLPGSTTQTTRMSRVKDLFWQYKVMAIATAAVLFAAFVIINRPFESDLSAAPAKPKTAVAPADDTTSKTSASKITKAKPEPVEDVEPEPDAPDAPAYAGGPVIEIRLRDLGEPVYRKAEEPSAQNKPEELLRRFQSRLREVTGRSQVRELTLNERVAELRKDLQRDPRDSSAQTRLAELAYQYFKKAQQFFNEGNFASAQNALDKGKTLFPEYRALHNDLANRLKNRSRLERLLAQAKVRLDEGRLVSPWRNNALYYYRSALKVDSELAVAQRGIRDVERALMQQARAKLAVGDLKEAGNLAKEALEIRPDNEEAKSFLLKLEQRRSGAPEVAKLEVVKPEIVEPAPRDTARSVSLREGVPLDAVTTKGPRIDQLRVDGKLLSGINARQIQSIPNQRTLFISFEYDDFPSGKSSLRAILLKGGKPVADVPVTVVEKKGLHRFRIEQARESFASGEYELRLTFDGAVLISVNFLLE